MAQQITDQQEIQELLSTLGSTAGKQMQGSLFAPSLLPRRLPLFKHGPEEEVTEATPHWH